MRSNLAQFTLNKLILGITLAVTCGVATPQAFAARKMAIRTKSVEEQLDRINRFQLDCLTLLKSPSEIFRSVEVFSVNANGLYSVRIKGRLLPDVKVAFESDEVTYSKKDGTTEKLNYSLTTSSLLANEDGDFSFVLLIPKSEVASVQLLFKSELDQSYILRVALNDRGHVTLAELDPVLDFTTKTKFCPRTSLSVSVGQTAVGLAQDLQSMNGSLEYTSKLAPSFGLRFNKSAGTRFEHIVTANMAQAEFKTASEFGKDTKFTNMSASYVLQHRNANWVRQMGESALHPSIRYGLSARTLPLARLDLADDLKIETPFTAKASLGGSLTLFSQSRWMGSAYVDLQYPFLTQGDAKGGFGYSLGASGAYAITKRIFLGSKISIEKDSYRYEHAQSLDRSGSVDLTTIELRISAGVLF
jgi:hypothetical protein